MPKGGYTKYHLEMYGKYRPYKCAGSQLGEHFRICYCLMNIYLTLNMVVYI